MNLNLIRKLRNYKKQGACSLVFDDGYKETLVNVLPILKKYKIKATFAFTLKPEILEKETNFPCASPLIAQKIKKLGHEIASHTISHKNLTHLKPKEIKNELAHSQKILEAQTIIYPGGKWNKQVITQAKKYYLAGRGVKEGLNNIPPDNFYRLKSSVLRQNTKWLLLNLLARKAHYQNKWLIESYHLVSEKEKNYRFTVSLQDFEKHLKKLIDLNLWIAPLGTVAQYIRKKAKDSDF